MRRRLNASELTEARLWARLAVTSRLDALGIERKAASMPELDQVRTFCLFIGYPRSGHSLVSSVLDAHPNALFSHRLNSLGYLRRGFDEKQLRYMAVRNAQRFGTGGRRLTGYQYDIAGQHQGGFTELLVVGDQEGKQTTEALAADPSLLDRLATFDADVRFIHAVRNPFDNISTWAVRTRRTLEATADHYFRLCATNREVRSRLAAEDVLDIHHDEFLAEPADNVRQLCHFVGLEADDDYVADCTAIFYSSPNRSRDRAPWTADLIRDVEKRMAEFDFLGGYSYED